MSEHFYEVPLPCALMLVVVMCQPSQKPTVHFLELFLCGTSACAERDSSIWTVTFEPPRTMGVLISLVEHTSQPLYVVGCIYLCNVYSCTLGENRHG